MMSVMSFLPVARISLLVTTWIGLALAAFGEAMRDPVTTISSMTGGAAFEGGAVCADAVSPQTLARSKYPSLPITRAARFRFRASAANEPCSAIIVSAPVNTLAMKAWCCALATLTRIRVLRASAPVRRLIADYLSRGASNKKCDVNAHCCDEAIVYGYRNSTPCSCECFPPRSHFPWRQRDVAL